jgi:hypothetical protein
MAKDAPNATPRPGESAGIRSGDKGTHTSRTIMVAEISDLFVELPAETDRDGYASAIIDDNLLAKRTESTRRLTNQRLGELYGLDPAIPIHRVHRRLWGADPAGRPLLALLCGLARDPLLRATSQPVLTLPVGTELARTSVLSSLRQSTGDRLNEAILDKVARNASSSWTQSGHLTGRVRKIRERVSPSFGPAAFAAWLGAAEGLAGQRLLDSPWTRPLDRSPDALLDLLLQAKQRGLLRATIGGGVFDIDTTPLDPAYEHPTA